MDVSKNRGTPKSSILIGISIIFTIHFGVPLFLETPKYSESLDLSIFFWTPKKHLGKQGWKYLSTKMPRNSEKA